MWYTVPLFKLTNKYWILSLMWGHLFRYIYFLILKIKHSFCSPNIFLQTLIIQNGQHLTSATPSIFFQVGILSRNKLENLIWTKAVQASNENHSNKSSWSEAAQIEIKSLQVVVSVSNIKVLSKWGFLCFSIII